MDVALTFDVEFGDHPCRAGNFECLLGRLLELDIPSTLFVQGEWALSAPAAELGLIREGPTLVGSHGHTHRAFTSLSEAEREYELDEAERALRTVGLDPQLPLFRLPYLEGQTDAEILTCLHARGWSNVGCQAGGTDWAPEVRYRPADVARKMLIDLDQRRSAGRVSSIALAHSWPDPTLAAIDEVIATCLALGDRFVTVADIPQEHRPTDIPGLPPA